jgi:hypothetical protein
MEFIKLIRLTRNELKRARKRARVTNAVKNNQRQILKISETQEYVYLEPTPPPGGGCGGNIERYYHFIVDLVLPFYFLVNKNSKAIFILGEFGILTDIFKALFLDRVKIISSFDTSKEAPTIKLLGMNPRCVEVKHSEIQNFSRSIQKGLGISQSEKPNKVLLVERLPPDPYYITQAKMKGGGATRRSIVNHKDLNLVLQSMVKEPFEFHNLQLEKIAFEQQVEYFSQACVVIAQHGAGLANCIWMQPGSVVIELNHSHSKDHFRAISKIKKHCYFCYEIASEHPEIDLDHFADWILNDPRLRTFFNRPCKG